MLLLLFLILLVIVVVIVVASKPSTLTPMGAHVMITGGSSGIGLAIAKECARLGGFVSIIARNEKRLEEAKVEIEKVMKAGGEKQKVITIQLDVAEDPEKVKTAIKQAEEKLGPVDFLFNCAGISHAQKFEDTDPEVFARVMKVNYLGTVYPTLAVVHGMKQRKQGRIIFTSSQAGQLGVFGYTAYSASKYALRGLAETLHMEVKPHNMAVTMAFPPDTDTPGFHMENEGDLKPEETKIISETSGLHSADSVAKRIVCDAIKGEFLSTIGLEGFLLGQITSGMSPCNSTLSALIQGTLLGLFRIVGLAFIRNFDSIVEKCARKQEIEENSNKED
uniref:3-ketodihydrosphingosine reductase-like n=1 Tax=Styela clava TaxID=7725 RepID=UPI00193A337C|nr:3-ketodihydrosphingosine reductase-like [Styela clava]